MEKEKLLQELTLMKDKQFVIESLYKEKIMETAEEAFQAYQQHPDAYSICTIAADGGWCGRCLVDYKYIFPGMDTYHIKASMNFFFVVYGPCLHDRSNRMTFFKLLPDYLAGLCRYYQNKPEIISPLAAEIIAQITLSVSCLFRHEYELCEKHFYNAIRIMDKKYKVINSSIEAPMLAYS